MSYTISRILGTSKPVDYKAEILSGFTVSLALVPEAIAFSMVAGFSPLTGLYATFILGLITSILGGRPAMISGATGAIAVIFIGLISELRGVFPDIEREQIMQYVFDSGIGWSITNTCRSIQIGKIHSTGTTFCNVRLCKRTGNNHIHGTIPQFPVYH